MEITEVRIKLMEDAGERLQGFCSITFDDCFVVRDLKIIEGSSGPFVAMPSRKLTAHCSQCGCKNHLRAGYCNQCGLRLACERGGRDEEGRAKLYADIAHPINSSCRELIQERVIQVFRGEVERSKLPGYVSSYDDIDEEAAAASAPRRHSERKPTAAPIEKVVAEKVAVEMVAVEKPTVLQPAAERTKVQPAATEPRAPHTAPVHQGVGRQGAGHVAPNRGGFGAGIW